MAYSLLRHAFADGQLGFYGDLKLLAKAKAFASFLRPLFRKDWVVYCKPPLGVQNMFSVISAAIPTAWRSPITA